MLVGNIDGRATLAALAVRGGEYRCPKCNGILVLKQGRIVIHHFAHKPPTDCTFASGETYAHMKAKTLVYEAFCSRSVRAELEYVVDTLPGDRRADVMIWSPSGRKRIAIELQHVAVGLEEIEARSFSYARVDIAQLWIPFLDRDELLRARQIGSVLVIERYSPRPFEKWIHGLYMRDGMWMYEPKSQTFWNAIIAPHKLYVEDRTFRDESGDELDAGGYYKNSKRYRDLYLIGPRNIGELKINITKRSAYQKHIYKWPPGSIASFLIQP